MLLFFIHFKAKYIIDFISFSYCMLFDNFYLTYMYSVIILYSMYGSG